jgi:methylated-DNA-[protein]-cysteine S-methyltransferase
MWTELETPMGPMRIVAQEGAITAVEFVAAPATAGDGGPRSSMTVAADRAAGRPVGERDDEDPLLAEAARQLGAYFAGELTEFDLPLRPVGSDFQQRVWEQLRQVGHGSTTSYGEIARRLGMKPGAARAVGMANGRNPIAIVIPCHRVVGASGLLSGYAGGVERKRALLDLENRVLF